MIGDYLRLALQNVRHRGIRSWLTLLGIIIGIAAVVALISLGQGLETAITGQFSTLSADRLVVTSAETGFGPPGSTAVQKLTEHDLTIIEGVHGVVRVVPRLIRVARVDYNKIASFEFMASLPQKQEDIEYLYSSFSMKTESGRLMDSQDRGAVVLGNDFKTNNAFDKDISVGTRLKIQGKEFEVVGILEKMSSFQFNSAIFIGEEDMKDILTIEDEIDLIVVQIEDSDESKEVAAEITRKMRKDRGLKEGEENFAVETPLQVISSVSTILTIINLVVAGIAAISLLIGAIGVTNTLFTSVVERTKEIGVMKSIGARNKDITIIFLIEAAFLGLIGGIVGALIGLLFAFIAAEGANAAFGSDLLSVHPSPLLIGGAVLFALVIGILAGIIPAWQASRLNPVEALRR